MKTIKQKYFINALPEDVFSAITNPFTIELWSGYPASMSPEENSDFAIFGGDITGKNLQVIKNRKLVQEWDFGEQEASSVVTIELIKNPQGTKVLLEHTNVPDKDAEEMEQGWRLYYWGAVKEFFK